jgi:hypothetical protein
MKRKEFQAMNKITGLMILLSVAIVLAAPQALAATSGWLNTTIDTYNGYYTSASPKVEGVPTPMTTCTVDCTGSLHAYRVRRVWRREILRRGPNSSLSQQTFFKVL